MKFFHTTLNYALLHRMLPALDLLLCANIIACAGLEKGREWLVHNLPPPLFSMKKSFI